MQVSVAALSILMVMAFSSLTSSAPMASHTPITCCFSLSREQIPRESVIAYYVTNRQCYQPAVVFKTENGEQTCASPSDDWVQKYMADPELK